MNQKLNILFSLIFLISCNWYRQKPESSIIPIDTSTVFNTSVENQDTLSEINKQWDYDQTGSQTIHTGNIRPDELVRYAKSLIGAPYKYASSNPNTGFDCSGFITYVFNHFQIVVPRSSVDFTTVEKTIPTKEAKAGDLILFTGTDSTTKIVGHMGIVTSRKREPISFIHSTSGKEYGVTITPLNTYYQGRFMSVKRIFNQNN